MCVCVCQSEQSFVPRFELERAAEWIYYRAEMRQLFNFAHWRRPAGRRASDLLANQAERASRRVDQLLASATAAPSLALLASASYDCFPLLVSTRAQAC